MGKGGGRRFPWGDLIRSDQGAYYSETNYSYDLGPAKPAIAASPVASFDVNGYGLYDMAGNFFEWCSDWYGVPYGQPGNINPAGPSGSGRVLRGGYWGLDASFARCAYRNFWEPDSVYSPGGFRCVRGL